jgi:hypothetical protein
VASTVGLGSNVVRSLAIIAGRLMVLGGTTQMFRRAAQAAAGGLLVKRGGPVVSERRVVAGSGDQVGSHLGPSPRPLSVLPRGTHLLNG